MRATESLDLLRRSKQTEFDGCWRSMQTMVLCEAALLALRIAWPFISGTWLANYLWFSTAMASITGRTWGAFSAAFSSACAASCFARWRGRPGSLRSWTRRAGRRWWQQQAPMPSRCRGNETQPAVLARTRRALSCGAHLELRQRPLRRASAAPAPPPGAARWILHAKHSNRRSRRPCARQRPPEIVCAPSRKDQPSQLVRYAARLRGRGGGLPP